MKRTFLILLLLNSFIFLYGQTSQEKQLIENKLQNILSNNGQSEGFKYYYYPVSSDKIIVLAFSNIDEYGCHACGVKANIFVLQNTKYDWAIINQILNAFETGAYGQPPLEDTYEIFFINPQKFLVSEHIGYVGSGVMETALRLFVIDKDKIIDQESIDLDYDDSGYIFDENQQTIITANLMYIEKGPDQFPEIKITYKGQKKGQTYFEIKRFYFNGSKYVEK